MPHRLIDMVGDGGAFDFLGRPAYWCTTGRLKHNWLKEVCNRYDVMYNWYIGMANGAREKYISKIGRYAQARVHGVV